MFPVQRPVPRTRVVPGQSPHYSLHDPGPGPQVLLSHAGLGVVAGQPGQAGGGGRRVDAGVAPSHLAHLHVTETVATKIPLL